LFELGNSVEGAPRRTSRPLRIPRIKHDPKSRPHVRLVELEPLL
jgi:hypothetical protein